MKSYCLLLLCCFIYSYTSAQEEQEWKEPSKASVAYYEYRHWEAEPSYGLAKVKALIKKIKFVETEGESGTQKPDEASYQALTLREKFTYHMIHGESYSQNCDIGQPEVDGEKKIFGHLPDVFGEDSWGDRQNKFFISNRDSVIQWIKAYATKDKRIGLNYKHVLVDINATEMIPFLISTYNINKKDHDILTMLILLMKNNEYQPFMVSSSNKKLYGGSDSERYYAFLNFNTANEELIIKRATDFYNGVGK